LNDFRKAFCPSQLRNCFSERRNLRKLVRTAIAPHEKADPANTLRLLRARRKRPSRSRTAEKRDEVAAS
jgi:hypothetical protein